MLLEQSRTCYFLWWNKSNIKEIKTTLRFAFQINISLKIINKLKFLGVPGNFPHWMGDLLAHKKNWFLNEILGVKNKSCIIEKMPVPALRFVHWHSHNNYAKIVPTSTCQAKLKKIMIEQNHVIRFNISCKWGNSSKTIISRIKTLCQKNLL